MSKPVVVSLPHQLGKQEAIRRLTDGIGYIKANYASKVTILEDHWDSDRLSFGVATFGQKASGFIDVADDHITFTVTLPLLLAMMAEKAKTLIRKEGRLLLDKK